MVLVENSKKIHVCIDMMTRKLVNMEEVNLVVVIDKILNNMMIENENCCVDTVTVVGLVKMVVVIVGVCMKNMWKKEDKQELNFVVSNRKSVVVDIVGFHMVTVYEQIVRLNQHRKFEIKMKYIFV